MIIIIVVKQGYSNFVKIVMHDLFADYKLVTYMYLI